MAKASKQDKNRKSRTHRSEGTKKNKYHEYMVRKASLRDDMTRTIATPKTSAPKSEPEITMAQAMADPRHQPTPQNIARAHSNRMYNDKPVLVRGLVTKCFASISSEENGFFFVRPDDREQAQKGYVYCKMKSGRTIVAERSPRFSDKRCSTPRIDDEIVAWAVLEKHNGRDQYRALRWGFASDWDMAALVIKNRFVYRCIEQRWENGRVTGEKILIETYDKTKLALEFPRELGKEDLLRPEQKFNGCSLRRTWERRNSSTGWRPCADPRPIKGHSLTFKVSTPETTPVATRELVDA